jgi:hypothetical protein
MGHQKKHPLLFHFRGKQHILDDTMVLSMINHLQPLYINNHICFGELTAVFDDAETTSLTKLLHGPFRRWPDRFKVFTFDFNDKSNQTKGAA